MNGHGGSRRGSGRKKGSRPESRNIQMSCRINSDEQKLISKAAKKIGISVSRLISDSVVFVSEILNE